ncbi:MAG: hypothetical protein AAF467_17360 [Actinomycetota bacterium]
MADDEIDERFGWAKDLAGQASEQALTEGAVSSVEVAGDAAASGCSAAVGDGCGGCGLDAGCMIALVSAVVCAALVIGSTLLGASLRPRSSGTRRRRG